MNRSRERQADPSDADPAVVGAQLARGAGEIRWHRIPASDNAEKVLQRAMRTIRMHLARTPVVADVRGI